MAAYTCLATLKSAVIACAVIEKNKKLRGSVASTDATMQKRLSTWLHSSSDSARWVKLQVLAGGSVDGRAGCAGWKC
jgi:hypothetical protein